MEVDELLASSLMDEVDRQLSTGDPPETAEAFERLRSVGFSDSEIRQMIVSVLVVERHTDVSEGSDFNRKRFSRMLAQLPQLPTQHWD